MGRVSASEMPATAYCLHDDDLDSNPMSHVMSPARRFISVFATDEDARRLATAGVACNVAAYVHLLLAAWDVLPPWTLLVSVPILVPRWMIAVHELFHLRSHREVDVVTRLLPFAFTFLSVGYRELLVNHRSHHRHMASPYDAEYYQLRGSRLAGLFNAFSAPEQAWFRWVAENRMDRELLRDSLIRLTVLLALIWSAGASFLWYWVPARLAFGLSYYVFFYCLHRRGDDFGVYQLAVPAPLARMATIVWGHDVVEATLHHDVHHAQPRIATKHLAESRVVLTGAQRQIEGCRLACTFRVDASAPGVRAMARERLNGLSPLTVSPEGRPFFLGRRLLDPRLDRRQATPMPGSASQRQNRRTFCSRVGFTARRISVRASILGSFTGGSPKSGWIRRLTGRILCDARRHR